MVQLSYTPFEGVTAHLAPSFPQSRISAPVAHSDDCVGTGAGASAYTGYLQGSRAWADDQLKNNLPSGSIINLLNNWDTGGLHGITQGRRNAEQNYPHDVRQGAVMAQEVAHSLGTFTDNKLYNHTWTPNNPGGYPDPGPPPPNLTSGQVEHGRIEDGAICLDITGPNPQLLVNS